MDPVYNCAHVIVLATKRMTSDAARRAFLQILIGILLSISREPVHTPEP
jgi:hypothetical protein